MGLLSSLTCSSTAYQAQHRRIDFCSAWSCPPPAASTVADPRQGVLQESRLPNQAADFALHPLQLVEVLDRPALVPHLHHAAACGMHLTRSPSTVLGDNSSKLLATWRMISACREQAQPALVC